jgi:hypothetical protein
VKQPEAEEPEAEVYHVELRQFPHNVCRFNLSERELRATVVERWAQEQWIEVGERKWSPHQAKLTVLQGPRLPLEQLSMGRGWRAAQREGRDVTEQVLAAEREDAAASREAAKVEPAAANGPHVPKAPIGQAQPAVAAEEVLLADSLGLELLSLLGDGPAPLHRVWELAQVRHPERSAGQSLVLAEQAVASLLRSQLVVLIWANRPDLAQAQIDGEEVEAQLRAVKSWTGEIVGLARR